MDFALSPLEFASFALALATAGLVTGFLAGLLGVGGGAILVPVLYEIFRLLGVDEAVRMHMVLGTSLAVIVPTALRSFAGHHAKGAVDMAIWRRLAPWVAGGVVIGVISAKYADQATLKWVWVAAGSLMAFKMAFGRDEWRIADRLPQSFAIEAVAVGIGVLSALMSIGGGMFVVTLLTLFGMPILSAVATSAGFGPVISIPGALGFVWAGMDVAGRPPFSLGYVNVLAAALVFPASMLAVPYGVSVAHAIPKRKLELAFAVFLTCVVTRFLISLL
ncbi:MAG: sulfite exporter TauE/SafE family protein [Hyphomicrobium sp.]